MNELNKLFEQAREGILPADFDQWGLKDRFGLSVAHAAGLRDGVYPSSGDVKD